ncbi:MAG: glycosyltransferase [Chloroflexota bacterium]
MTFSEPNHWPRRVAMISAHTCPLSVPGKYKTGGLNVYVLELSRELSRRGVAVDVYTRLRDPEKPEVVWFAERARVIHLVAGSPQGRCGDAVLFEHLPGFVDEIAQFAVQEDLTYELVHGHYWLSGWVAAQLKGRWGTPMVQMFHTLGQVKNLVAQDGTPREPPLRIETERWVVGQADRLVAVNSVESAQLIWFYGAKPEQLHIVPGGVDTLLFRPIPKAQARRHLELEDGARVVLFVGRLDPIKGIEVLFGAFARLCANHSSGPCRLLVVGGDRDRERDKLQALRETAAGLGVAPEVQFIGSVEQQHLPYYYSAADVCVVPSYSESFGLVAMEAMACGTPVIASRVGGLQFTVQDGHTGFLVPPRDLSALADRMESLLRRPELAARMGKAGVERAREYSWARVAESILAVYGELRQVARLPEGDKRAATF